MAINLCRALQMFHNTAHNNKINSTEGINMKNVVNHSSQMQKNRGVIVLDLMRRPSTANCYSFKKLTDILQGKYISIQSKMGGKSYAKLPQDKKKGGIPVCMRSTRNPSIENKKPIKQQNDRINLLEADRYIRGQQEARNQVQSLKQNQFVPYASQSTFKRKTETEIPDKTRKKLQSATKRRNDRAEKIQGEQEEQQKIQEWKNEDEEINFSSLFKKAWQF